MGPGFEDVFRIENGDIPASYVSLPEGKPGIIQLPILEDQIMQM